MSLCTGHLAWISHKIKHGFRTEFCGKSGLQSWCPCNPDVFTSPDHAASWARSFPSCGKAHLVPVCVHPSVAVPVEEEHSTAQVAKDHSETGVRGWCLRRPLNPAGLWISEERADELRLCRDTEQPFPSAAVARRLWKCSISPAVTRFPKEEATSVALALPRKGHSNAWMQLGQVACTTLCALPLRTLLLLQRAGVF